VSASQLASAASRSAHRHACAHNISIICWKNMNRDFDSGTHTVIPWSLEGGTNISEWRKISIFRVVEIKRRTVLKILNF